MKGIRFKSAAGYTQIDTRYVNTAFIRKGTATGTGYVDISVPAGCTCAVRPDIPALCVPIAADGGHTLRVRVGPDRHSGSVAINVEYFIFGPPSQAAPVGTKGVRIRRQDGSVAYDSRLRYMKVVGVEPPAGRYPSHEAQAGESNSAEKYARDRLLGSNYYAVSRGVKLAAIVVTPRFSQGVEYPYGPPDYSSNVKDFITTANAECVRAAGDDIRLYDVYYANARLSVPISTEEPEVIGRDGSGTILINVAGL